jgi:hypothetical protein
MRPKSAVTLPKGKQCLRMTRSQLKEGRERGFFVMLSVYIFGFVYPTRQEFG